MYILRCLFRYMRTIEMDTAMEEHTQNQEGIGSRVHICTYRYEFTYMYKWKVHKWETALHEYVGTCAPLSPSWLYKVTERPGAVQTSLKGTHTAVAISSWGRKKWILQNTVWENKTGESTHQMAGTKIMPEYTPAKSTASNSVSQTARAVIHTSIRCKKNIHHLPTGY